MNNFLYVVVFLWKNLIAFGDLNKLSCGGLSMYFLRNTSQCNSALINARTNARLYFSAMHCLISSHFKTFTAIYEISIFIIMRKLLRMPLHYKLNKSAINEFLFTFNEVVCAINRF